MLLPALNLYKVDNPVPYVLPPILFQLPDWQVGMFVLKIANSITCAYVNYQKTTIDTALSSTKQHPARCMYILKRIVF